MDKVTLILTENKTIVILGDPITKKGPWFEAEISQQRNKQKKYHWQLHIWII